MGVTTHWVDKEWNLQDLLLGAVEVKGRHDGENLSSLLSTSMKHHDSVEKVFCITANNASNNGTMAPRRPTGPQTWSPSHFDPSAWATVGQNYILQCPHIPVDGSFFRNISRSSHKKTNKCGRTCQSVTFVKNSGNKIHPLVDAFFSSIYFIIQIEFNSPKYSVLRLFLDICKGRSQNWASNLPALPQIYQLWRLVTDCPPIEGSQPLNRVFLASWRYHR